MIEPENPQISEKPEDYLSNLREGIRQEFLDVGVELNKETEEEEEVLVEKPEDKWTGFVKDLTTWDLPKTMEAAYTSFEEETQKFSTGLMTQFGEVDKPSIEFISEEIRQQLSNTLVGQMASNINNIIDYGSELVGSGVRKVKETGWVNLRQEVHRGNRDFGDMITYLQDSYNWRDGGEMLALRDSFEEELGKYGITLNEEQQDRGWDYFKNTSDKHKSIEFIVDDLNQAAKEVESFLSRPGPIEDLVFERGEITADELETIKEERTKREHLKSGPRSYDRSKGKRKSPEFPPISVSSLLETFENIKEQAALLEEFNLTEEELELVSSIKDISKEDILLNNAQWTGYYKAEGAHPAGKHRIDQHKLFGLIKSLQILGESTQAKINEDTPSFSKDFPDVNLVEVMNTAIDRVYAQGGIPKEFGDPDTFKEDFGQVSPYADFTLAERFSNPFQAVFRGIPDLVTRRGFNYPNMSVGDMIEDIISGDYFARVLAQDPQEIITNPAFNRTLDSANDYIQMGITKLFSSLSEVDTEEVFRTSYIAPLKAAGVALKNAARDLMGEDKAETFLNAINPLSITTFQHMFNKAAQRGEDENTIKMQKAYNIFTRLIQQAAEENEIRELKKDLLLQELEKINDPNPEDVRQWWVAKQLKEAGFEDPTGNNWEGDTIGEAIDAHVIAAVNKDIDVVRRAYILDLSAQSYKHANSWTKKGVGMESLDKLVTGLYSQSQRTGVATESGLIDAFLGGNSNISNRMLQGERFSQSSENMIKEMVDKFNAVYQRVYREEAPDGFEGSGESLIPILNAERIINGEWGVNLGKLSSVKLGNLSRTMAVWGQTHKRKTLPPLIKEIGNELAYRARLLDGQLPNGHSAEPIDKKRALLAIRTMGRLLGEKEGYAFEQYFSAVPPVERALFKALARASMDKERSVGGTGLSTDEFIYRWGLQDEFNIKPQDLTVDDINNGFREIYGITDVFIDALHIAESQESADQTTDSIETRRLTSRVISDFRTGDYRKTNSDGRVVTLDNLGIKPTLYDGIVTASSKPQDFTDDNTARLVSMLQDNRFFTEDVLGESGLNAGVLEEKLMHLLSVNTRTREYLTGLITANRTTNSSMSTLSLLEDTLTLATMDGILGIRTGDNPDDFTFTSFDPTTPGVQEAMNSIPTVRGSSDERTKITQAGRALPGWVPNAGRNNTTWAQFQLPFYEKSRDLAKRQIVTWDIGLNQKDIDTLDVYYDEMIQNERSLFLSRDDYNARSYQDILFGMVDRFLSDNGIDTSYTNLRAIMESSKDNPEDDFARIYDLKFRLKTDQGTRAFLDSTGSPQMEVYIDSLDRPKGRSIELFTDNIMVEETLELGTGSWKEYNKLEEEMGKYNRWWEVGGAEVWSIATFQSAYMGANLRQSLGISSTEEENTYIRRWAAEAWKHRAKRWHSYENYGKMMHYYGQWENPQRSPEDATKAAARERWNSRLRESVIQGDDDTSTAIIKALLNL